MNSVISVAGEYLRFRFQWRISHLLNVSVLQKDDDDNKRFTTEELIQIIHEAEEYLEVKCTSEVSELFLKDARMREAKLQHIVQALYTPKEGIHIGNYNRESSAGGIIDENCEGCLILIRICEEFLSTYIPEDESVFNDKEEPKQLCSECDTVENYRTAHLKTLDPKLSLLNNIFSLLLSSRVQNPRHNLTRAELLPIVHTAEEKAGVKCASEASLEYYWNRASTMLHMFIQHSTTNLTPEENQQCNDFFSTYFVSEEKSVICDKEKPEQRCSDREVDKDKGQQVKEKNEKVANFFEEEEEDEEEEFICDVDESKPLMSRVKVEEKTTCHKASWWGSSLFQ